LAAGKLVGGTHYLPFSDLLRALHILKNKGRGMQKGVIVTSPLIGISNG